MDNFSFDNLNINSFRVLIDKLPMFTFKLKSIDTPSLTLNAVPSPNPMQKMMVPGDTLEYGTLSMSFLVDENLYNYTGVMRWMMGLGFPDSFEQFRELIGNQSAVGKRSYTQRETSDIDIILLTNHVNPNRILKLHNAFPTALSGISLNNSNTEAEPVEVNVEFTFTGMQFTN